MNISAYDVEQGEFEKMDSAFPELVICGDKRRLSAESGGLLATDETSRYFGGAYGLAETAVSAIGMQSELPYREMKEILEDFEGGITGVARHISCLAEKKGSIITVHSSEDAEEHPSKLNANKETPLGCGFLANLGTVVVNQGNETTRQYSKILSEYGGKKIDYGTIDESVETSNILEAIIGGEEFNVKRQDLIEPDGSAAANPVVILSGSPKVEDDTAGIIDLEGLVIKPDGENYAHSVPLAEKVLSKIFSSYKLDPKVLSASGLTLAIGTLQTLGVKNIKYIPSV